jgi:hypothetical protein
MQQKFSYSAFAKYHSQFLVPTLRTAIASSYLIERCFYIARRSGHGRSSVKYAPQDKYFFAVFIMANPTRLTICSHFIA